jgi:hypothetical protein
MDVGTTKCCAGIQQRDWLFAQKFKGNFLHREPIVKNGNSSLNTRTTNALNGSPSSVRRTMQRIFIFHRMFIVVWNSLLIYFLHRKDTTSLDYYETGNYNRLFTYVLSPLRSIDCSHTQFMLTYRPCLGSCSCPCPTVA